MFRKGLLVAASALLVGLAGSSAVIAQEDNVLKIASHLPPMTDIVEIAGEVIEAPYLIELVEVSDNIQYNEALLNDEVYANFAQHAPFMEAFNEERDGDLVSVQPIYNAVLGFYSPVYDSIDELEDGAEVAIPSDATNEARALLILAQHDLIKVDESVTAPTVEDIVENPHNLEFTHIDLLNLAGAYEDGIELVFHYPTYIAPLGLTPADAVILEEDDTYLFAIALILREGNLDNEATAALQKAFTSPEVYAFLDELAEEGHLEPAFELEETEESAE